jgi:predicted aconitase with swiveling domain
MMSSERPRLITGRPMVAGTAVGRALVLDHGLSFAMALDVSSGRITDVHSPYAGRCVSGRVLVMPSGRGSSSASTALAETIRLGTAPAAMVLAGMDEILAVGAVVARVLYGRTCPMVVVAAQDMATIRTGDGVEIRSDGSVAVRRATIEATAGGEDETAATHRP